MSWRRTTWGSADVALVLGALLCSACGSSSSPRSAADASAKSRDAGRDAGPETTFSRDAAREAPPADDAAPQLGDARFDAPAGRSCLSNSDCQAPDFCQKSSCDRSVAGTCVPTPGTEETGFCQSETDFVCGCDGKTYTYPCLAHAQSVNIAAQGPCPLPDGGGICVNTSDCGTGLYCKKASCGAATGICTGEPDFVVCLAAEVDAGVPPACGCDHRTYGSDCEAASYGVSVDFEGQCPPLPSGPCTSQADCGDPSYQPLVFCQPTTCGAPAGVCTAIPNACPELYIPVCGCNGQTYTNSCFAQLARTGWSSGDAGCP